METCDVLYFSDKVFENLIFIPVIVNGIEVTALFDTGVDIVCGAKWVIDYQSHYFAISNIVEKE